VAGSITPAADRREDTSVEPVNKEPDVVADGDETTRDAISIGDPHPDARSGQGIGISAV